MNRKLPEIELAGQIYIVDVECRALLLKEDKQHSIAFSDMADNGAYYVIRFNDQERRRAYPRERGKYIKEYKVPPMVILDPEGVAIMYSTTVDQLPQRDRDLRQDPELLRQRQQGRQPIIKLVGHEFYVDLHWGLLRPKDDFNTLGINMNKLPLDESGHRYAFLYDSKTHEAIPFDPELTEMPKHVYAMEIPNKNFLDPYAVQRKYGCENETAFYDTFPIRYNMEARIIPWSETLVPALIAANKAKLGKAKKETPKKRRGKRP